MRVSRLTTGRLRLTDVECTCGRLIRLDAHTGLTVVQVNGRCTSHRVVPIDWLDLPPRLEDLVYEGFKAGA